MTRRTFSMTAIAAAMPAFSAAPKSIFNGINFTGWRRAGNGMWGIEDGAIVARFNPGRPGPGYLFTDDEYADFDLRLEFWISKGGNSGIFIRQPWRNFGTTGNDRPAHSPGDGVEVQIDYNDPKNMTGAIYDLRKPDTIRGGEERWVRYRIACTGPKVNVWIDGDQVNSYDGLKSPRGAIGLQMHGQKPHDHVVKFRKFEIIS